MAFKSKDFGGFWLFHLMAACWRLTCTRLEVSIFAVFNPSLIFGWPAGELAPVAPGRM